MSTGRLSQLALAGALALAPLACKSRVEPAPVAQPIQARPSPTPAPAPRRPPRLVSLEELPPVPEGWTRYHDGASGLALAHPAGLRISVQGGWLCLDDGEARGTPLLVGIAADRFPPEVPLPSGRRRLPRLYAFLAERQGTLEAARGALEPYGLSGAFDVRKVGDRELGPVTGVELARVAVAASSALTCATR